MATCNPDPDSWVMNWVEYYLDDGGFPRNDLCGKVRYFLIVDDKPKFADTPEELEAEYPELVWVDDPITNQKVYVPPLTFAFISGTINQ